MYIEYLFYSNEARESRIRVNDQINQLLRLRKRHKERAAHEEEKKM